MEQIFISSVQKELQEERYAVRDFVHGNDLLRQFSRVFLFEDLLSADRRLCGKRTRREGRNHRTRHILPAAPETRHKPDKPDVSNMAGERAVCAQSNQKRMG